ncbi:MAG: hypothetical protein K0B09_06220 [Bacteroidales bacterium]|nr:hypothetical protein [Bacteroidales bacterium]
MEKIKMLFVLLTGMVLSYAVFGGQSFSPPDTLNVKEQEAPTDTVEYELLIIDPGFDMWFQRNMRPASYYSLSYLENWNRQLVNQWNMMIARPGRPGCMPSNYVHYDPNENYGLELNHKLFYYFKYVQQRCRIFDSFPRSW